jgi:hypothetical protein
MTDGPDVARHMARVARELLGAPNERLSKQDKELRYGTNGSLSIDLDKGTFFDFETNQGGGVLDLIEREKGLTGFAAFELMEQIVGGERSERVPPNGGRKLIATFDYHDADGKLAFQVLRYEPKDFRQRRPDGNGGWDYHGGPPLLYRLPQVLEAVAQERPVFIVEGERKVDALAKWNVPATCNAGGAEKWKPEHSRHLSGAEVVILPDNDQPGRKHATMVGAALQGIATSVRVLELPGLKQKGDVLNWIGGGGTAEQFWRLVETQAQPWAPYSDDPSPPKPAPVIIKSSREFVAGFVPPEYVLVGILQRRFFYSLTGQTGAGKTALCLLLAACAALGRDFAGRETKCSRVLYLAAENADDVRMRWIALAQNMDFDIDTIEVFFVEGRFSLSQSLQALRAEAKRHGGEFGLVIVDTGPTFFEGKDENENKQLGDHARMLRSLIDTVPGGPCVVANCHPTKNAQPDQLIPRGGGAFLAETDGNLTAAKTDTTVELHWQGKFRGPDFAPMYFLIKSVTHQDLRDRDGRLIPTVIADYISEQAREDIAAAAQQDENKVLAFIKANPTASLANIATAMGWKLHNGDPHKMKASRCVRALTKAKLVKVTRAGHYTLTPEGDKEIDGDA